jgi:hypothetical protein
MFRTLLKAMRELSARRGKQPSLRHVPALELLEDRVLPSKYTWNWKQNNQNNQSVRWTTGSNWIKIGNDPGTYPGQNVDTDTVVFDKTSNNLCWMDARAKIATLTIDSTFSNKLMILNTLTITGAGTQDNGTNEVAGFQALHLGNNATFNWNGGSWATWIGNSGNRPSAPQNPYSLNLGKLAIRFWFGTPRSRADRNSPCRAGFLLSGGGDSRQAASSSIAAEQSSPTSRTPRRRDSPACLRLSRLSSLELFWVRPTS